VAAGFSPRQFGVGAFGDAAENRADLVPIAMAQAEALTGVRFEPKQVVIIGDSVRDVQTAQLAGARSIAVATGEHSREMLEAAGADYVFNDLSNTKKVLRAIFAS
ncbi:MAG: HAD hydrolase-like protein, partial [Chloroflexi bacterium]|nr:HAD hydrolase-like protein [Chloroflexota bacterium]